MRGFSLLELLIGLALLALLMSLTLVAMPSLVQGKRAQTALHELRVAINYARHAAIVHGYNVVICPKGETSCGPRNSWHNGALIFADHERNGSFDDQDVLLSQTPSLPHGRIYWRAFRSRSYLLFTPRGVTDWQNGHFLYCPTDDNPRNARQLVLNAAGRTYPSKDRNKDGVHEDVRGKPLRCP